MEEEFVPKKINSTSEEPKKEEYDEIKKDNDLNEMSNIDLSNEQKTNESNENKTSKKKRSVGRIISRIISAIIFLFLLFEVVMGILNMQRLNEDKEPIWYFDCKTEKVNNKTQTTYNLGLYVIRKTVDGAEKKLELKSFLLK